jgi:DNA-binding LacI/PurR family transcriptional regulator
MANQKELAKLAGVSAGTVSNVVSGSKNVSDKARKKVLEAIRKLGYRPNLIARSLKTNRTKTLGIVVPDLTFSFNPKLIRGAQSAAREHGYLLIVLESADNEELELELIALLEAQRVEGIVLISASGKWRSKANLSGNRSGPPIVCLDRVPDGLDTDSIRVDGRAGAEMGIAHLLQRGHRKIAIITGPLTLPSERERLSGYRHALERKGIKLRDSLIWRGETTAEIERACLDGLLRSKERPSAVFTTNGFVALEALRCIYAAGLSTPEDLAFATFDEIAAADFFQPAITCVVQPTFEMGRRAVELLLERINSGDAPGGYKRIMLPPKLVVRASSSLKFGTE